MLKFGWFNQSCLDCRFPNPLGHGRKGLPGEPFDQFRLAGIHVNHSRRYTDGGKACLEKQGIQFSPDHGVAAGPALQFNLALYRPVRRFAVRVKIDRAVIPFDDCNRAARFQMLFQCAQRLDGLGEMLQDEADKNVIEEVRAIGQMEEIPLFKFNIRQARRRCRFPGFKKGCLGNVDRGNEGVRAVPGKGYRLRANATTGFQNMASGRVRGVGVQQIDQGRGLVL